MEFGSIKLHHETVSQAAAELKQAGHMMDDSLRDLMNKLGAVIDGGHFQGAAALAFHEFSQQVSANASAMDNDIAAAAATLTTMHEIMTESDGQAGKQFT
ncbi:WXG100 family type VII secretion target [Kitasatospora sp. DSM 101779]|uniref:WXG100 family type VII secretion target n=1 Tax=Kitasatospora sp. DSM 101779 TaxID=2853165 RepID=UPI0021D7FB6D|nr:WXG100 family type VII secretion target [Kitasatospora sp. DSM 101779]MCU7825976.1 WXG100 family type VII secretion target [Kitasatospora sp. DSM 101779]